MTLTRYPNSTGQMPHSLGIKPSSGARSRSILTRAWNGSLGGKTVTGSDGSTVKGIAFTPFRAVNNAGDPLAREQYSCGGSSQTNASRPGLKNIIGSIKNNCDGTTIETCTCNAKYVYDSSNYSRFKKEQSLNRNYYDKSYGGDSNNASQTQRRR